MRHKPYPPQHLLDERQAWAAQWQRCFLCNSPGSWLPLQCHEICRRSQSSQWADTCNYLRVCQSCHDDILCNVTRSPYAAQLAVKALKDAEHYDLPRWLEIIGRGPLVVTEHEVELCVRTLQMVGFGERNWR